MSRVDIEPESAVLANGRSWAWPDVVSLELLVAVARLGSLTRAAASHGLSQPSASARLRSLEREMGITLLERGPTGSRPTSAGWRVVELAGAVLDAFDGFQAEIASIRASSGGRLRLAASYTVGEYLLPNWLGPFHRDHPKVEVALEVANSVRVAERVLSGRADLGFVEGPELPGGLRSKQVADDELVVVVCPTHPWARRRRPVEVIELVATPLVLREPGSGTREAFQAAVGTKGAGNAPSSVLELGSTAAVKAAVAGGFGPGVMSRLAVEAELASGALVSVAVEDLDLHRRLMAVWPSGSSLSPMAGAFLKTL